jgi:two-component system response regulator AtoC
MELALQAKLLRVLEDGAYRRVGGLKDIPMNARIIAASNKDLRKASEAGDFRLDLYFRLSIIQIDIPPLRDRGEDIILLAQHYIEKANHKRRDVKLKGLSSEVAKMFKGYAWAGNVRELRNVIERASILEDGDLVTTAHLPADMVERRIINAGNSSSSIVLPANGVSLETLEQELAKQAMDRCGGNLTQAAKLLEISRDQLRYKLKKSGAYTSEIAD